MSSTFLTWLGQRLLAAPPALAATMRAALPAADCTPNDVAAAAESLMLDARSRAASREGALTLLAADALVTLACEWRSRGTASGA